MMRFSRSLGRMLGGLILLGALVTGSAGTAQAHDVLIATSPGSGATVAVVPGSVSMTFNETPIALGGQVEVLDPSGANQADGAMSITDTVATQKIKAGAPAGAYTVHWRVVSSDSHPIEGTFTFTARAAGAAADASTGAAGTSSAAASAQATLGTGSATPVAQAPAASSGTNPLPIIVIVVGVIVLAGFGLWMLRSSRRRAAEDDDRG